MIDLIIAEGTRGGGKSSVTRVLRNRIEGSTLINPTGFKLNGEAGKLKILTYYNGLFDFLERLAADATCHYTVIFDRFFFSEQVYSSLYKDYDFTEYYTAYLHHLIGIGAKVSLYHFKASEQSLFERLNRDKVKLFESVDETINESMKQQRAYDALFEELVRKIESYGLNHRFRIDTILTDENTPEEIANGIYDDLMQSVFEDQQRQV